MKIAISTCGNAHDTCTTIIMQNSLVEHMYVYQLHFDTTSYEDTTFRVCTFNKFITSHCCIYLLCMTFLLVWFAFYLLVCSVVCIVCVHGVKFDAPFLLVLQILLCISFSQKEIVF